MKGPGVAVWALIVVVACFTAMWMWTNHQTYRIDSRLEHVDSFTIAGCMRANVRAVEIQKDVLIVKQALLLAAQDSASRAIASDPKLRNLNIKLAKSYSHLAGEVIVPVGPRVCRP